MRCSSNCCRGRREIWEALPEREERRGAPALLPPALAMEAPQGALGAIMPRNVAERKPVAQLQSEVQRERPPSPPLPSLLRSAPSAVPTVLTAPARGRSSACSR